MINISVDDDGAAGHWWEKKPGGGAGDDHADRGARAPGKTAQAYSIQGNATVMFDRVGIVHDIHRAGSVHDDATIVFDRAGIVHDDATIVFDPAGIVPDDATIVFADIDDVGTAGLGEVALPENDQRLVTLIDQSRVIRLDGAGTDGIAVMSLVELPRVRARLGFHASDQLRAQVETWIADQPGSARVVDSDDVGNIVLLVAPGRPREVRQQLEQLSRNLAAKTFAIHEEHIPVTPVVGFASFGAGAATPDVLRRATRAARVAGERLDLTAVAWSPEVGAETALPPPRSFTRRLLARMLPVSSAGQIACTFLIGLGVPYLLYSVLGALGVGFTGPVYDALVTAFVITAGSIWIECLLALEPPRPPERARAPYPQASAVIAAYLPNESATIRDTLDAFLALDYPGPLEVILAYNTPEPLPIEHELRELAEREPRLRLLQVEGSTSKAQNVNAALSVITGEFVGIFDADHHPDKGNFERAWRWISSGVDIVQGHCVVRNGSSSWVSSLVAVEFESVYAASHPGRARFHDFGIFGGSNGYWRSSLLRQVRMQGDMLTEDIDSSLRALERSARIVSDPALRSRELAPTTIGALFHQRLRWAQGWFQVSVKHLPRLARSRELSRRQRAGLCFLMGWGQVYPWVGLQVYPFLAYLALHQGNGQKMYWFIPLFLVTSIFTFSVGLGQTLFAYLLATPEVRCHRRWFAIYFVLATVFYTEFKNVVSRVAQLKELRGESQWRVTPRAAGEEGGTSEAAA